MNKKVEPANLTRIGRTRRPVTVNPRDAGNLSTFQRGRRDEIVRQALRMLETHEFADIQVRDVAIRSDVAIGTVYRYFASKDHLFAAAIQEWGRSFEKELVADPLHGSTAAERLRDLVGRIFDALEQRPQITRLMSALDTSTDPLARGLYLEFAALTHQIVEASVAPLDGDRAAVVQHTVLLLLGGALRSWVTGVLTPDQVRQRVMDAIDLISPTGTSPR